MDCNGQKIHKLYLRWRHSLDVDVTSFLEWYDSIHEASKLSGLSFEEQDEIFLARAAHEAGIGRMLEDDYR